MCLKLSLLLTGLSMAMAYRLQMSLKTDEKIHQLKSDSLLLAENHKDYSSKCFQIYNPQLKSLSDKFEKEYDTCIVDSERATRMVDESYRETRLQMESSVHKSCESLKYCEKLSTAYNVFDCAATRASEDAKIFYEISVNAANAAAQSKSDYAGVQNRKTLCVNDAEWKYVEDTSKVYEQLNDCLVRKMPNGPPANVEVPAPPSGQFTPDDFLEAPPNGPDSPGVDFEAPVPPNGYSPGADSEVPAPPHGSLTPELDFKVPSPPNGSPSVDPEIPKFPQPPTVG
ncbi:hypothetical protein ACLKA7_011270 [Drosophila subpalustris]